MTGLGFLTVTYTFGARLGAGFDVAVEVDAVIGLDSKGGAKAEEDPDATGCDRV